MAPPQRWRNAFRPVAWTPYAAGVAGMALLLGLLAAASMHRERVRQYEQASAQTATLAHLLEASVGGMLGEIDALLASLAGQASDGASPIDLAAMRRRMASALASTPEVARWTLCTDGLPPIHVGGEVALPAGCQDVLSSGATGMQLAGPLRRAPQAPWILAFSRAWQNAATGERGRIVAELPVERFERVFGELQLGRQGAATLRTAQLALVYRHPWSGSAERVGDQQVSQRLREQLLQSPQAGVYQTVTPLDQVERLNAYRRLHDYPLYVLVGYPAREYPRGWRGTDLAVLVLAGATLLVAGLAALALYRTSQRRVAAATRRFEALVATSNDAIVAKTLHGTVTSWNAAAERIFGWRADEMIGHSIRRLYPPEREQEEDDILERVRRGEWVQHFDTERLRANGRRIAVSITISPLLDPGGRIVGASMIARDISRQKALEAELRALAFHDALTQLPNRRLFLDRLRHAQEASRRSRSHGGVLFVDLDHFKHLNDRHGHDVGDLMLQEVARRLRTAVRAHDTVARLGGDEFVVLCEQLGHDSDVAEHALRRMADKLSRVLGDDFHLGPVAWPYGASIGLRLFCGTDEDPEALLRDADRAMYQDKEKRHTESGVWSDRDDGRGSSGAVDIPL